LHNKFLKKNIHLISITCGLFKSNISIYLSILKLKALSIL